MPNNPRGLDRTSLLLSQAPGESENVEEMTILLLRSPQRRGWRRSLWGHSVLALLSPFWPLAWMCHPCGERNGHPLAGLLSFLLPNPVTWETAWDYASPDPASVCSGHLWCSTITSLARWSWWLGKKLSCEPDVSCGNHLSVNYTGVSWWWLG